MEKSLTYALKLIAWLKIPAVLALAIVFFLPPNFIQTNAYILSLMSQQRASMSRQSEDATTVEIQQLQHRLDVLEELRIDASIASMKATIEYDHTLLMTIAGATMLMLLSHVLGFLKQRRDPPTDPPAARKGYEHVFP